LLHLIDLGNPAGIIRWYKTNQSDPLGAISADLILDNPQVSDGGTYWCQVENTISSAISNRLTIKFAGNYNKMYMQHFVLHAPILGLGDL